MIMRRFGAIILFFLSSISVFSFEEIGSASWYGPNFHGKLTANGERFNTNDFTAAHKTLPFNSIVKVVSLENSKEVIVRINDRGPFAKGRIIDLSKSAAESLDLIKKGTAKVKIILLEKGDAKYHRYSSQKYSIQAASFSNPNNANKMLAKLIENNVNAKLIKTSGDRTYYRVVIENLNYSELQKHRVKLHVLGIHNFQTKKL